MNDNDFREIESVIGYEFKNKYLLKQAFIRKSYSQQNEWWQTRTYASPLTRKTNKNYNK